MSGPRKELTTRHGRHGEDCCIGRKSVVVGLRPSLLGYRNPHSPLQQGDFRTSQPTHIARWSIDRQGRVWYKASFGGLCAPSCGVVQNAADGRERLSGIMWLSPKVATRTPPKELSVPCSERRKEIKRRRHRRLKITKYGKKVEAANVSEKAIVVDKLRALTPGSEVIIKAWDLDKR